MLVRQSWNPLVMDHDKEFVSVVEGLSPNEIIREYRLLFTRRVVVLVESQYSSGYWSRADWDCPVPVGATVRFVELPRGGGDSNPLQVLATMALIAASVYFPPALGLVGVTGALASGAILIGGTLLLNMFFGVNTPNSADTGDAKNIYSLNSGGNSLRIGEPFAEWFGKIKRFPDLVQLSYTRIEDNEQYLYFYMILGVGYYDVEGVFIDDTPFLDYSDASYNILPPGKTQLPDGRYVESIPSIVTNVVWPCMEISGQELDTEGMVAIVSARGTEALFIEYDLLFPALVKFNNSGGLSNVSVTVICDVRLVDDDGGPLGDWVELHRRTYSAASIDPLRYSNKCPAPLGPGRYEAKIRREAEGSDSSKVQDTVSAIGLRAYGGLHPYYGDVTCIEGRVRASDKLNGELTSKINVVATRKLPKVTDSGWEIGDDGGPALYPSISIVDAIAYMVLSENGGRQDSTFFTWDIISALKTTVDAQGHGFNYIFTSQGSVMDAVKAAAQCSRMAPYLPGGKFCLVRDDYQEIPAIVYTDDDIDEGSLTLSYKLATPDSPTCVRINFLNGNTWADDFVVYFDENGSEDLPYTLDLHGCTSRQQAYEHAAYLYNDMMLNGVEFSFTTGLKGHIPALFKKVALAASHVDWGQTGKIAAVETGKIWLSEPVNFKGQASGQLYVTEADGTAGGPYSVTPVEGTSYCVNGAIFGLKTLQDDGLQATNYMFGPVTEEPMFFRLMRIQPQERGKVKLIGTIIDDATYDLPGTAPDPVIPIPDTDPLVSMSLIQTGDLGYTASWIGGATTFKVEVNLGSGYTTLEDNYAGFLKSFTIDSLASVTVKVAPYYSGSLLTSEALTATVALIPAPTGLDVTMDGDSVDAAWDAVTGADSYNVDLYVDSELIAGVLTETTIYSVTTSELTALGGPWPDIEVRVSANVDGRIGLEATDTASAPSLAAPTGLALQSILSSAVILSWNAVSGATGYKLYYGTTDGFDPATEGTLAYAGTNVSTTVPVDDLTTPYAHYFKVAATEAYHQNVGDLIFSSQLAVTG